MAACLRFGALICCRKWMMISDSPKPSPIYAPAIPAGITSAPSPLCCRIGLSRAISVRSVTSAAYLRSGTALVPDRVLILTHGRMLRVGAVRARNSDHRSWSAPSGSSRHSSNVRFAPHSLSQRCADPAQSPCVLYRACSELSKTPPQILFFSESSGGSHESACWILQSLRFLTFYSITRFRDSGKRGKRDTFRHDRCLQAWNKTSLVHGSGGCRTV